VDHARAAVIAQTAPLGEDILLGGECQCDHRGKADEKRLEAVDDYGNARLLEHDLRDPDRVWIGIATPRQVTPVDRVPIE
jgi:hypothetical protein